ncbi:hypothetical protein Tco_1259016, partial [Tanacetum coccineum]
CTPETVEPTGPSIHQEDEKVTLAEVETDTEELLIPTEKSGEEVSNTVVLGTESGGQDEKQGGPDPSDSAESRPLPSQGIHTGSSLDPMDEGFIATAYPNVQENLKLTVEEQVSKAVDEIVTDVVDWAIQALLRDRIRDLPEADIKEIVHHRMWESNSYKAHEDHKKLYEALEKSMDRDQTDQLLTDLAKARRKKKMRHDSPKTPPGSPPHQPPPPPPPAGPSGTLGSSGASGSSQFPPPPPPPSTNQSDQSKTTAAPSSSKTAASAEYTAWTTIDTRLKPSVSSIPEDLHMDDDLTPDEQVHSSDDEDIRNDHIHKVNLKQDWWKPLSEEDRPATPEPAWSIPSSDLPVPMNNWASALASTYAPPPENSLLA